MSICLPRRLVIARWQEDGWDEPCKSRGLRTVLWAALVVKFLRPTRQYHDFILFRSSVACLRLMARRAFWAKDS
jgi:hypothetical protein